MSRRGENIYLRKDGRYEGRYVMGKKPNGATKFGYVFGRQFVEVRRRLNMKKAEFGRQQESLVYTRKTTTLEIWFMRWLNDEVAARVKPSTFQAYQSIVVKHILPLMGGMYLHELTVTSVLGFLDKLRSSGLADSTVAGIYRVLCAGVAFAHAEGEIPRNPCKKIKPKCTETRAQRVLTTKEQADLHKEASAADLPTLLGLYTGMRIGEICALKWEDINWEDYSVKVRRTAQRLKCSSAGKKTMIMLGSPKSLKSHRTIPLPRFIIELLAKQKETAASSVFVFGKQDKPAETRTVQRQLQRLTKKLGLVGVHFHTLRHSFATRLLELGADIKTVSELLGHSSTRMTLEVYVHSLLEQCRSAIDKLAAAFS